MTEVGDRATPGAEVGPKLISAPSPSRARDEPEMSDAMVLAAKPDLLREFHRGLPLVCLLGGRRSIQSELSGPALNIAGRRKAGARADLHLASRGALTRGNAPDWALRLRRNIESHEMGAVVAEGLAIDGLRGRPLTLGLTKQF